MVAKTPASGQAQASGATRGDAPITVVRTDVTGSIALFLAAAALLLTSFTFLRFGAWRRAQTRVAAALLDLTTRLSAATELIDRSLARFADEARIASYLSDLAGAWDFEDALQRVADAAVGVTGARGALVTTRGAGAERRMRSSGDVTAAEASIGWPFEAAQAMTFATLQHGDPGGRSTAYGAAVPLKGVTTDSSGVLVAFFAASEAAVQGLELLERVAAAAAPVLDAAPAAMRPIDRERAADPGIGVSARVAFQVELAREAARARREGTPLAVALIEVDGVRSPAERAGHAPADQLLARIAELLDSVRPAASRLYRVGGDEFALVLPGQTGEDARRLVAELRTAHRKRDDDALLQLSVGVAELEPNDDVVSLTARAGAALEATKQPRLSPADEGA
jgi:diguanylate cyclase (GGDEF)-like protein